MFFFLLSSLSKHQLKILRLFCFLFIFIFIFNFKALQTDENNNKIQKRTTPGKLARGQRDATSPIEKRPFPVYLSKSSPVVWKRTWWRTIWQGLRGGGGVGEGLVGLQAYHFLLGLIFFLIRFIYSLLSKLWSNKKARIALSKVENLLIWRQVIHVDSSGREFLKSHGNSFIASKTVKT